MDFGPGAAGSIVLKAKPRRDGVREAEVQKTDLPPQKKILQRIIKSEWGLYENESLRTILESNQAGFNARARA